MASILLNDETFAPAFIEQATGERAGGQMSIGGVARKSLLLLAVTCAAGAIGWRFAGRVVDPGYWIWAWLIAGFVLLIALSAVVAKYPKIAFGLGLAYAVAQGIYLGSISKLYNDRWAGIVPQAILVTLCVFVVCLALYNLRIVQDTDAFNRMVVAATIGVVLLYLVAFLLSQAGVDINFWDDLGTFGTILGVIFAVIVALVAAFNLFVDFDVVLDGVGRGAPKSMEWYSAFGLLATLIWLYLQVLNLLEMSRRA